MKKFILFIFICVIAFGYYFYKNNNNSFSMKSAAALTTSNGKYKYKNFDKNFKGYLSKYRNGKLLSKFKSSKKIVIYTNVVDTSCPYRRNFQKNMAAYSKSADWTKKYYFIKEDTTQSAQMSFKSMDEYNEYKAFLDNCSVFCIIDPGNEFVFRGEKNTDDYVYDVLASFYNN